MLISNWNAATSMRMFAQSSIFSLMILRKKRPGRCQIGRYLKQCAARHAQATAHSTHFSWRRLTGDGGHRTSVGRSSVTSTRSSGRMALEPMAGLIDDDDDDACDLDGLDAMAGAGVWRMGGDGRADRAW